jgi:hypothetical protein
VVRARSLYGSVAVLAHWWVATQVSAPCTYINRERTYLDYCVATRELCFRPGNVIESDTGKVGKHCARVNPSCLTSLVHCSLLRRTGRTQAAFTAPRPG